MAYTQEDLTSVKNAIIRLATGQQRVTVQFSSASGSRTTTYKSANLDELRALEQQITESLAGAAQPSRTVLTRSRKGL